MADRKLSSSSAFASSSPGRGRRNPGSPARSGSESSSPGLSALRTLGGPVPPLANPGPGPDEGSARPRGNSLGSRLRAAASGRKHRRGRQEEPDALLDLILESQAQRLEDQRASLSLLPDPGPSAVCGTCSCERPDLDFYCMLIHFQSDRMEDQRCPLPDPDSAAGPDSEDRENFFGLIQRIQSRRMDEQRAPLTHTCSSAPASPRHGQ